MSEGLTLDETLSLTEKLQKAEARALAAEKVLDDARKHWRIVTKECYELSPMAKILNSLDLTAAAALSGYRDEVLEEVAKEADARAESYRQSSSGYHSLGNGVLGMHYELVSRLFSEFSAEIRAMQKGGGK